MKKVLLRAPLLTNSGYGIHSRQIFKWLESRDDIDLYVECLNWGMTTWILNPENENGLIGRIMSKSKEPGKEKFDISYQVQLPNEWNPELAKFNVGVTAAVETDKCNPKWVDFCNKMDHIIVPSVFTKNVIKRSGMLNKKISVVSEWYNSNLTNRSIIDKSLNKNKNFKAIDNKFNVLVVAQLTGQTPETDRKNLLNTLKWLFEELEEKKDSGIVIKTSFGKGTEIDKSISKEYLENVIKTFRKGDYPKVHFIHGNASQEDMAALYHHKNIKAYALATRGEGYGLPFIEAAASGLPIVATNWSGHLEFLNKDTFYPVKYTLIPVDEKKVDNNIFISGFKWAEPSEESFKENIRDIYENPEKAKEKAKKQQKHVLQNFNKSVIYKKYTDLLDSWET